MTSSLCLSESVYKTCQRQPTELKLGKLIVHSKFHKIRKFEKHVTRNDVIMTSLPKTMEKCGPPRNQKNYIGIDESYPKMYFLLNLIHYVKSYWHLCQILAFFYDARSPNMAMSRDPRSTFRKNYFFLILHLILGKITKFLVEKLSTSEVVGQNVTGGGVENTPAPQCF